MRDGWGVVEHSGEDDILVADRVEDRNCAEVKLESLWDCSTCSTTADDDASILARLAGSSVTALLSTPPL